MRHLGFSVYVSFIALALLAWMLCALVTCVSGH